MSPKVVGPKFAGPRGIGIDKAAGGQGARERVGVAGPVDDPGEVGRGADGIARAGPAVLPEGLEDPERFIATQRQRADQAPKLHV